MTPNPPTGQNRPDQLMEEAALWFARMRGPEAEVHRAAFDAWLTRGALHRGAYNRAAEIFSMGKLLDKSPGGLPPAPTQHPDRSTRLVSRRGVAFVASSAAVMMLASWLISEGNLVNVTGGKVERGSSAQVAATYAVMVIETPAGESRAERLVDGSLVTLGPTSRLQLRFDARRRDLTLVRGRARFEVAHEARPFVVDAEGTRVTARGTVFDVAIDPLRRITVKLLEGVVDVARPGPGARSTERLAPGQSVVFAPSVDEAVAGSTGALDKLGGSPPDMFGQPDLMRSFERARLADVIQQANRIARVPIQFADPALGNLRISGRFQIDDTDRLAERSAAVFDLKIDRSDPDRIVLKAR